MTEEIKSAANKVTGVLSRPLWAGGKTLTMGELLCWAIAVAIWYFHFLGKWSAYAALGVLLLSAIIW